MQAPGRVQVDETVDELARDDLEAIEIARDLARGADRTRAGHRGARDFVGREAADDAGHLFGVLEKLPGRDEGEEVDAVDELHDDEPRLAIGDELVEHHEIRMREIGERAELALEPEEPAGIGMAEELQRDAGVPLRVERLVDDTEPAGAEAALQTKAVGGLEDLERHFLVRCGGASSADFSNCSRSASGMP